MVPVIRTRVSLPDKSVTCYILKDHIIKLGKQMKDPCTGKHTTLTMKVSLKDAKM
jgi:hypothetical protein